MGMRGKELENILDTIGLKIKDLAVFRVVEEERSAVDTQAGEREINRRYEALRKAISRNSDVSEWKYYLYNHERYRGYFASSDSDGSLKSEEDIKGFFQMASALERLSESHGINGHSINRQGFHA